jgi:hypothetical protein
VRVHDVAATREVLDVLETLSGRREIDRGYLLPDVLRHERTAAPAPPGG